MAGFISGKTNLAVGSVSTAALADNAVTLAKMSGGTDGNLIGIDANGDPAYIATGTDGQVLTSGGANVAALMETSAAGGSLVKLAEDTNITGATKTFSSLDLTPYTTVYFEIARAENESGSANGKMTLELSVDNASSWLSTNAYKCDRSEGNATWAFVSEASAATTIELCYFQWPDLDMYHWGEMLFPDGHGKEVQIYCRGISTKSTAADHVAHNTFALVTDTSGNDIDAMRFATTVDDFGGAAIRIWGGLT